MFFLLSFLLLGDLVPYPLVRSVDDTIRSDRDEYMSHPIGAVYHQETLYVGDRSHKVFVINSDGQVRTIGAKGQGPKEFAQHPMLLSITQEGLLEVIGWNYFERTVFKTSGEFVRKEKLTGHERLPFPSWLVKPLPVSEVFDSGKLYRNVNQDCLFGSLTEKTSLGWYTNYTSRLAESGEGHLVVARNSGKVEVYQKDCHLLASTKINLERFKVEIIPNPLLTKMYKKQGWDVRGHSYGTPVADLAARDRKTIWILIRDEPAGLGGKQPDWKYSLMGKVMWLAEVDALQLKPTFLFKLDIPVSAISYANGYLILISDSDSTVRVYEVGK